MGWELSWLAPGAESLLPISLTHSSSAAGRVLGACCRLLQAPAVFTGSDVRIRDPDQPSLQFAVAFKGASWTDPDSIPLMVMQVGGGVVRAGGQRSAVWRVEAARFNLGSWAARVGCGSGGARWISLQTTDRCAPPPSAPPPPRVQTMLGSWDKNSGAGTDMASKLAQAVSANKLASSYMAFNTNYHDTGLWGVYAVADAGGDQEDLAWAIMRHVSALCYTVDPEDVARARNQLKASILFSQDGTTGACGGRGSGGTRCRAAACCACCAVCCWIPAAPVVSCFVCCCCCCPC